MKKKETTAAQILKSGDSVPLNEPSDEEIDKTVNELTKELAYIASLKNITEETLNTRVDC